MSGELQFGNGRGKSEGANPEIRKKPEIRKLNYVVTAISFGLRICRSFGRISFFGRGEKPKLDVKHFQIGRMERAPRNAGLRPAATLSAPTPYGMSTILNAAGVYLECGDMSLLWLHG
jgi:hypothetical protein